MWAISPVSCVIWAKFLILVGLLLCQGSVDDHTGDLIGLWGRLIQNSQREAPSTVGSSAQ